jgi:hypothetical protein
MTVSVVQMAGVMGTRGVVAPLLPVQSPVAAWARDGTSASASAAARALRELDFERRCLLMGGRG